MEPAKRRPEGKVYQAEETLKYKLTWKVIGTEKKGQWLNNEGVA